MPQGTYLLFGWNKKWNMERWTHKVFTSTEIILIRIFLEVEYMYRKVLFVPDKLCVINWPDKYCSFKYNLNWWIFHDFCLFACVLFPFRSFQEALSINSSVTFDIISYCVTNLMKRSNYFIFGIVSNEGI